MTSQLDFKIIIEAPDGGCLPAKVAVSVDRTPRPLQNIYQHRVSGSHPDVKQLLLDSSYGAQLDYITTKHYANVVPTAAAALHTGCPNKRKITLNVTKELN